MMDWKFFFKVIGVVVVVGIVARIWMNFDDARTLAAKTGRAQGVSEVDTNWDASIATEY